jgi:hypothetical protein
MGNESFEEILIRFYKKGKCFQLKADLKGKTIANKASART